jgi:hemerythrin-like domain-containing protein
MNLADLYEFVFSEESKNQRKMPVHVHNTIKSKIDLGKVRNICIKLKREKKINPDEFDKLSKFIKEWTEQRKDDHKVSIMKDMLVKSAYKADIEWSAYVEILEGMEQDVLIETLLLGFPNGGTGTISPVHKARLLECITYAIKVGLNTQELAPFKFYWRSVPRKNLDDDDLSYVYPDKVVSEEEMAALSKRKKVHVGDLKAKPLYENIYIPNADLGDYISAEKLKDVPDMLVNPTKRRVLQMIYEISPDFKLNLDELDEEQLKKLCRLDLPFDEAMDYFYCVEHEEALLEKLDEAYKQWLLNDSYKKYMGKMSANRFLTLEPIRKVGVKSVDDVLNGDFWALKSLVYYVKSSEAGVPDITQYIPDTDYAMRLSKQLQDLGVLPPGFDHYCAVKGETLEVKTDSPVHKRAMKADAQWEDIPEAVGKKRKGI